MKTKEFTATYGIEKEATIFNEDGSSYKIHIELLWNKGKTLDGFKYMVQEAKEMLDSFLSNR